ncbi:DUF885 domain-containing protein [Natronosporangium hydrolyticum]|uniref:DUF885 domain-containing protein n=1 Tax=Natronosporangium hydrolyticum TaxID=2811111 RepID=A0A895YD43_9ACTN|nr:DUF885 domain-containing protein [Natronosporangium hydrolyticum]QSB15451.1 DUF885 domain-containing protein [Natronosporangium hydrolyticum]
MSTTADAAAATASVTDELYQLALDAYPLRLSVAGIREREDQLPDLSAAGEEALRDRLGALAEQAAAIDPASLTPADRVTRSVVRRVAESMRDELDTHKVEYAITDNALFAPGIEILAMLPMLTLTEPAHAEGYLARLRLLPELLATVADRHRAGVAAGRVPVARLVSAAVAHLDRLLESELAPLRAVSAPESVTDFTDRRDQLIAEVVQPAVASYREVLASEILPHGRPDERPGLCWLPKGDAYYATLIRVHTTTERTAQELHETGQRVIAELANEYAEVGGRLFGITTVSEIQQRLRTDPELRWRDGDELVTHARDTIVRAEQAAPEWFGVLPKQRCAVEPVPESQAASSPAAYYFPPALDGSRPGTYFANTHEADQRGRATYEAVAFHEAVPGHHFQLALAQELTDLPLVRRLVGFTGYTEGWGLYAERLADEMGLYSDDLARLGMLSEDSMRAARLVVDTGLHALGWSRQQAVDYLREHTATPEVEIESEVDRYIAEPGQALAYMVGRLEIQRLRSEAEQRLGPRFDLRGFHDTVLGSGALPLTVLEELVAEWAAGLAAR